MFWLAAFANTLANLRSFSRLSSHPIPHPPRVSVIIPARNEERAIRQTVSAFLRQSWSDLEVIVVDDRSTDETAAILRELADPRLVVIDGTETPAGWLGKPWALQQGALASSGDVLVFCDADVHWEPAAVDAAVTTLFARGLEGLTVFPRLVMKGFWEHVLMVNLPLALVAFLPIWLFNLNRGTRMTVGGGVGNIVTRVAWEKAGTHEALRNAVVDDVGMMRNVRQSGGRVEVFRGSHLASIRMYHGLREIVRGFSKNAWYATGASWPAFAIVFASIALQLVPYAAVLALGFSLWRGAPAEPWVVTGSIALGLLTGVRVIAFRSLGYRMDNAILGHPLMILVWAWIGIRSAWMNGVRRRLEWRGRSFAAGEVRSGLG